MKIYKKSGQMQDESQSSNVPKRLTMHIRRVIIIRLGSIFLHLTSHKRPSRTTNYTLSEDIWNPQVGSTTAQCSQEDI